MKHESFGHKGLEKINTSQTKYTEHLLVARLEIFHEYCYFEKTISIFSTFNVWCVKQNKFGISRIITNVYWLYSIACKKDLKWDRLMDKVGVTFWLNKIIIMIILILHLCFLSSFDQQRNRTILLTFDAKFVFELKAPCCNMQ